MFLEFPLLDFGFVNLKFHTLVRAGKIPCCCCHGEAAVHSGHRPDALTSGPEAQCPSELSVSLCEGGSRGWVCVLLRKHVLVPQRGRGSVLVPAVWARASPG